MTTLRARLQSVGTLSLLCLHQCIKPFGGANVKEYFKSGFDGTVRNIIIAVDGFSAFNAGKLTGPDGNEMDTESFLASLKVITMKDIEAAQLNGSEVYTSAFRKIVNPIPRRNTEVRQGIVNTQVFATLTARLPRLTR